MPLELHWGKKVLPFVLLYLICVVLELSFISQNNHNMKRWNKWWKKLKFLICSSVSCGFIYGNYSRRLFIKQGAELNAVHLVCWSVPSRVFSFLTHKNVIALLTDKEKGLPKELRLFFLNDTDPFIMSESHEDNSTSAISQQNIPKSMFHAGCNISSCTTTPPVKINLHSVCAREERKTILH